jgi:Methyltransferase domain
MRPVKRIVQPELLDDLAPGDARAIHSRADLRRLNRVMRHAAILSAALVRYASRPPRVIAELGAGDGTLMLALARQLSSRWPGVRVILLDRQELVSNATRSSFDALGWKAQAVTADVFEWLAADRTACDVIIGNLFLHHFPDDRLAELLRLIAQHSDLFVACETRRDWPSFVVTPFLGLLGCNSVTRHDARLSVEAGFVGRELSALWPARDDWQLTERRAMFFTHFFAASRSLRR